MKKSFTREGRIADVVGGRIFQGILKVDDGVIVSITEQATQSTSTILPGLIDAHVHIESSMLVPSEFASMAVLHGTVATVSDPHEIANVLGTEGVQYMIRNSETVPFKFYFGAPSCVPATSFESSGAVLNSSHIESLLKNPKIKYLSEMMNFPGVLAGDSEVLKKLSAARKAGKPVDGHAPGLTGESVKQYIEAGISTDHECFTLEEAKEKIGYGMKVQIREGSAAKNFDTLVSLLGSHPADVMLCSDDKHPDDLLKGHINDLVRRAIRLGYDPMDVLRSCTLTPATHYNLDVGLLQVGDPADFIVVDSLDSFYVKETFIDGHRVAQDGKTLFHTHKGDTPNSFAAKPIDKNQIHIPARSSRILIIEAMEGQLITRRSTVEGTIRNDALVSDPERDILKILVMNRYKMADPAVAFIRGIGLKRGAIASTVAHDSHNIVAVGSNDDDLVEAVNLLIGTKGGIVLVDGDKHHHLPLPVAGIMSNEDGRKVAHLYETLNLEAKKLGTTLEAPFMTLSFMSLLVIPELKLSDRGLFDGNQFSFVSLYAD